MHFLIKTDSLMQAPTYPCSIHGKPLTGLGGEYSQQSRLATCLVKSEIQTC